MYRQKYLKYKKKYIDLKNLKGGADLLVDAPVGRPVGRPVVTPAVAPAVAPAAVAVAAVAAVARDPLQKYIDKQRIHYGRALAEITAGHKVGCWIWWIFPTSPYMVVTGDGTYEERGSSTNKTYALRSLDEAHAYAENATLGPNLIEIMNAASTKLEADVTPLVLFGSLDVPKVVSCVQLFRAITAAADVNGIQAACVRLATALIAQEVAVPDMVEGDIRFTVADAE